MSQFDFGTIDPNVKTGSQLAADLNQWRTALHSSHGGVARPAYAIPGMLWLDQQSPTDWRLKIATATGDTMIGTLNPTANTYRILFGDGTLVAPAITWANEPTAGWYRSAAQNFLYAVDGVPVFGLTKTQFNTGAAVAVNIPFTLSVGNTATFAGAVNATGIITGAGVVATQAYTAIGHGNSSCSLNQNGLTVRGAAGAYGPIVLRGTDGSSFIQPFNWSPTVAGGLGQHSFERLQGDANSSFKIYGGAYGAGAGASLNFFYSGSLIAGISTSLIDGTPGSQRAELRLSVVRAGVFGPADMKLGYNGSLLPQLTIASGWNNDLANIFNAPINVQGNAPGGSQPGMVLGGGDGNGSVWTSVANTHYWACQGGGGPLSGWAMNLSGAGGCTALSFTPTSDRALKENICPLQNALRDVLRLVGVRFRNRITKRDDIGLVAQDVEPIFPEIVGEAMPPPSEKEPNPTPVKTLNYNALIAPIIEALRELNARVLTLEGGPK